MTMTSATNEGSGAQAATDHLLEVRGLKKHFPIRRGVLQRHVGDVKAVDGLDFTVGRGETLSLVGESGCGKTTAGKALLQLVSASGGRARYGGQELLELSPADGLVAGSPPTPTAFPVLETVAGKARTPRGTLKHDQLGRM